MTKTSKLSTWLLWGPLKFSLISLTLMILIMVAYSLIAGIFSQDTQPIHHTPIFASLIISFVISIYILARKLPKIKMDRTSFISIHNAQTILSFFLFSFSTYLLLSHQQEIMFKLIELDSKYSGSLLFILILLSLYLLYMTGLYITNLYAKILRIQQFQIPLWKIILSIPFGFSALWIPGYLLSTKPEKNISLPIKSKWYSKLIKWTISDNINTISMFVFITALSGFFIGFTPMLLTFTFTLIFGIWTLKIGSKKFEYKIKNKYSTVAVIINIIFITIFAMMYTTSKPSNIQINITDTQITTQGQ